QGVPPDPRGRLRGGRVDAGAPLAKAVADDSPQQRRRSSPAPALARPSPPKKSHARKTHVLSSKNLLLHPNLHERLAHLPLAGTGRTESDPRPTREQSIGVEAEPALDAGSAPRLRRTRDERGPALAPRAPIRRQRLDDERGRVSPIHGVARIGSGLHA